MRTLQPHAPWFAGTVLWGTWRTTTDLGSFALTHMWNYVRTMELVEYKHLLQEVTVSLGMFSNDDWGMVENPQKKHPSSSFQWFQVPGTYSVWSLLYHVARSAPVWISDDWFCSTLNPKLSLFSQWDLSRRMKVKPVLSSEYNSWSTRCISSHTITAVSHHITDLFILGTIIVGV